MERYTRPSRELLAVLQLFRAHQAIVFSYEIEEGPAFAEVNIGGEAVTLYNDTVIGFDSKGRELVRVTVDEPIHERPGKLNSI